MPTPGSPSSHSGGDPQPVNPYAATQIPDANVSPGSSAFGDRIRNYHAQLDWSDRRAFLRAIAFDRFVLIGTGLWALKYIFDLLRYWGSFIASNTLNGSYRVALILFVLLAVVQGVFTLYVCWLSWKNIDYLREVTGGTTGDFHQWSRLHLLTARCSAASLLLMLIVELGIWFVQRVHA
jgi:hypothetical protein